MKHYSAFKWILIDVATQYGLDKLTFDKRIEWTKANISQLESLANKEWKEKPLYIKAVMALRDVQKGKPTGHMIGVDASASGIQCMSALTNCINGANATGLIDPNVRADIYTSSTAVINELLHKEGLSIDIPRDEMKQAIMTTMYGSKAIPLALFGEETPQLHAFYKAMKLVAPGAWELLQDLLNAWQPYALKHEWTMPDGFEVSIKVMDKKECRIEVDEMDHAQLSYVYYENQGTKKGISLPANFTHSTDSLLVREMHRRVNYDVNVINDAKEAIENALADAHVAECGDATVNRYKALYEASGFVSLVVAGLLPKHAQSFSKKHLKALLKVCEDVLKYSPVPLVSIHDQYSTLPSGVNSVRFHYKELMAELAESSILDSTFSQIIGTSVKYQKLGNIANQIRQSEYALC